LNEHSVKTALGLRTRILEAAVRVIGRDGVGGVKSAAVAGEAGVSPGLIHYYFETLSVLTREAFLYADNVTSREMPELATEPMSGRDELALRLQAWLEGGDAYAEAWAVWGEMWYASHHSEEIRRLLEKMWSDWVALIEAVSERGKSDGSILGVIEAASAARRLTALMESLGQQLTIALISAAAARRLMEEALVIELDRPPGTSPSALGAVAVP
jgi:DNA-binding transcriptional regulator YbjK